MTDEEFNAALLDPDQYANTILNAKSPRTTVQRWLEHPTISEQPNNDDD